MSNQRIADMAANLCNANPQINPLTAVFSAMQALDPNPGAAFVVESVCDMSQISAALAAAPKENA